MELVKVIEVVTYTVISEKKVLKKSTITLLDKGRQSVFIICMSLKLLYSYSDYKKNKDIIKNTIKNI